MAVVTSTQSGPWSAPSTWAGGIAPVAADVVTVAAGHVVTFDVDMSGWTSGVDLTINGTLDVATTVSTVMRIVATLSIRGSGIYSAGSAATPLPRAIKHTVNLVGRTSTGFDLAGGLRALLYCWQPANATTLTTAAVAVGATVIPVADDVSTQWDVGAEVYVCSPTAQDSELRTIASIAAGQITLSTGLTNAKPTGAIVVAVNRNIRVLGALNQWSFNGGAVAATPSYLGCEIRGTLATTGGAGHTLAGPVSGATYAMQYPGPGWKITGTITACTYACVGGTRELFSGLILGCNYGMHSVTNSVCTGQISGCAYGVPYGNGNVFSGRISGNSAGDFFVAAAQLFGVSMGLVTGYLATSSTDPLMSVDSRNHAGSGERRTWSSGGYTAKDLAPPSGGPSSAQKMTMQMAAYPCYLEDKVRVEAGRKLRIGGMHKLGQVGITVRPRIWIIDPGNDPLLVPGAVPLAEWIPADDTTWQAVALSYTPPSDGQVIVRWVGQHTIANAWWNLVIPDRALQLKRADGSWAVP